MVRSDRISASPCREFDRLAGPAEPAAGHPELSKLYSQALLDAGRPDEAREFLADAAAWFPKDPEVACRYDSGPRRQQFLKGDLRLLRRESMSEPLEGFLLHS